MSQSPSSRDAHKRRPQRVYLHPHVTGYPRTVCIHPTGKVKHGPRVTFLDARQRWVAISIAEDPEVQTPQRYSMSPHDLRMARWFILLNRHALLEYWYGRMTDPSELKRSLRPVHDHLCQQYRFSSFALAPYTTRSTGVRRTLIIIGDDDRHAIPVLRVQGHLSPADLEDVQRFIQLNRSILLEYWYLKIGIDTLGDRMQKIDAQDVRRERP
jgi:hypothetical protein